MTTIQDSQITVDNEELKCVIASLAWLRLTPDHRRKLFEPTLASMGAFDDEEKRHMSPYREIEDRNIAYYERVISGEEPMDVDQITTTVAYALFRIPFEKVRTASADELFELATTK